MVNREGKECVRRDADFQAQDIASMLGIIGGSSLLDSALFKNSAEKRIVSTPYGSVELYVADESSKFGRKLVFCQRHHADPGVPYSLPHKINRQAIAAAFRQEGVTKVIGFGSVGGLKAEFAPGTVTVCDDFFNLWTAVSMNNDASAHIVPSYDESLRTEIVDILKEGGIVFKPFGVYVQTNGPRFETKAEVRFLATLGDIVGMTGADEAVLCKEAGLAYASICMVDNFANGASTGTLAYSDFKDGVARHLETVEKIAGLVVAKVK